MNRGKISITQLILRQKAKILMIAKLQALLTIMQLLVVKTKTSCVRKGVSLQRIPKAWICIQNKLPSVEEFFISEDDVWIVAKSQTSSEKILFPDTGDPVIVVLVTVENRSTSLNFGKLKYSHIKRCTKVKRKGRNRGREESLDIVTSTFTFNQCVVEDSCSEHSVMNKAVAASEISSYKENEESGDGLFSMRSRVRPKRKTKTSLSERSKILN